ncbi:MAG: HAD hydrolase family protein [Verrucomicrobia bacterium]|nr:HAD hydrolase family protein [Verrucomicrobiota bacterium]
MSVLGDENLNKGIIALDIDGTVTAEGHQMPSQVQLYLKHLAQTGWLLIFVTGRTFSYGWEVLKVCEFPFYYAIYNGAAILQMPSSKIIWRCEISPSLAVTLFNALKEQGIEPLFHTNIDQGNRCYWRPSLHSQAGREYLRRRRSFTTELWVEVEEFSFLENFVYAKVFDQFERLRQLLLPAGVEHSLIKDPLRPGYGVLLITAAGANKGSALRHFREQMGDDLPVIAAGDDWNDLALLQEADISIAMATAPQEIKEIATLIAPSSQEMGIIEGLEKAIKEIVKLN